MDQFPHTPPGRAHPARRSRLEAQLGYVSVLSLRAVDAVQRVSEPNMQLTRQLLDAGLSTCRDVLACADPAHAAAAATQGPQQSGERLLDYRHRLSGLMAAVQAELPASGAARG